MPLFDKNIYPSILECKLFQQILANKQDHFLIDFTQYNDIKCIIIYQSYYCAAVTVIGSSNRYFPREVRHEQERALT